jgi:hypothetical protein
MSNFKKMVEARIEKTGESWSTAAGYVRAASGAGSKAEATTAPANGGTVEGTSGPPDGDGMVPGSAPGPEVLPRKHVTHHVFVDLDEGRRRLGVALSDPPMTGGFVIDSFEYPADAPQAELLAEAERRNGPLRIQYPNDKLGESFPATALGLDEAVMLCSALAQHGREIRLLSRRSVLLKHWNPNSAKAFRSFEVGMNGAPGPRHFAGECPSCNAPMRGVIPAGKAIMEFTCNACGGKFVAKRRSALQEQLIGEALGKIPDVPGA